MTDHLCLTLVCPPAVEEKLLDTLLAHAADEIFTSTPTYSHGIALDRLSATEQVMGRSRAIQVNVLLTHSEFALLRELLAREFAGTGLRWWACALAFQGDLA